MLNKKFSFIEAPVYQGQKHFGVSLGSAFLRQMLLDQCYKFDSFSTLAAQSSTEINLDIYEELSYLVERETRRQKLIFVAGGDHSLSIGSVQGMLRSYPNLKVLWVDAHGDINTRSTSTTESFHGMPLAFLLGLDPLFRETGWFDAYLRPENLIYFGLRDLDPAELKFLDDLKIQRFSAKDIRESSLETIIQKICGDLQNQIVHISVDADAFDPSLAPATGVTVSNGLSYRDVERLVEAVLEVADVRCFEYVELNPQIFEYSSDVFKTAQIGIDLFRCVLEKNKQQEVPHGFDDRFGDTEEPGLHDPHFELEEQGLFKS